MRARSLAPWLVLLVSVAAPARSGVVVYEKDGKKLEIGGRLQAQYHREDPSDGDATDEVFFRRLRPYIKGSFSKNWHAKIQFDVGKSSGGNEVAVKDAYARFTGWKRVNLTLGNFKPAYSREFLTSSKRQQLVERTFPGDHNYGSPDRVVGIGLTGKSEDKKITYGVSLGSSSLDPDAKKLDFDTPVNRDSDWDEGWLLAGRVDFHPFGELKFGQGDFARDTKLTIGIAAYTWQNDDDNNTYTDPDGTSTSSSKADVDSANGFELSFGVRGNGFSLDGEYQKVSADTTDAKFTGGLFRDGSTDLDIYALEAGYMVHPEHFEIVAGHESLDADNYETPWTRTSLGMNYFIKKHSAKVQLTYRIGSDLNGTRGKDRDEMFLQFQYVF